MKRMIQNAIVAALTLLAGVSNSSADPFNWTPIGESFIDYRLSGTPYGGCNVELRDRIKKTSTDIRFRVTVVQETDKQETTKNGSVYIGPYSESGRTYFPDCKTVLEIEIIGGERK